MRALTGPLGKLGSEGGSKLHHLIRSSVHSAKSPCPSLKRLSTKRFFDLIENGLDENAFLNSTKIPFFQFQI